MTEPKIEKRPTILIADDDPDILSLLERVLRQDGYNIVSAGDGMSAILQFRAQRPELVILDISMPGMEGFQALEELRQISEVPVIMLTARTEPASINGALNIGADDYIKKPFSIPILLARVQAKLRRT